MGAALDLTPVYGRSVKGTRAYGEKPTSPGTRISTLGAAVPGKQFAYDGSSMASLLEKSARTEHAPLARPFLFKNFGDSKQRSLKNSGGISMD
jgi:hypothetical protein